MGAYEYILTLDKITFEEFISKGIFRTNIKRDKDVYEYYLSQITANTVMQAITNTATKFDISEETVFRSIRKMR